MKYDVVVQPRAERDIKLAAHWILGQSGSAATATRWARNLRIRIATLKMNPQRCPIDADSEVYRQEVRVLLHFPIMPGAFDHPCSRFSRVFLDSLDSRRIRGCLDSSGFTSKPPHDKHRGAK